MTEPHVLILPPDCTIRTVRTLQGEITAALAGVAAVRLDGALVERVDVSFVQIVVSATRAAGRRGRDFALVNPSPVTEAAFRRAGFGPHGALLS